MDGLHRLESNDSLPRLIEGVFRGTVFRAPMTTHGYLSDTLGTIISSAVLLPLRSPRITTKLAPVGIDVFRHNYVWLDAIRFHAMKIPKKNRLTQIGYYRMPIREGSSIYLTETP